MTNQKHTHSGCFRTIEKLEKQNAKLVEALRGLVFRPQQELDNYNHNAFYNAKQALKDCEG